MLIHRINSYPATAVSSTNTLKSVGSQPYQPDCSLLMSSGTPMLKNFLLAYNMRICTLGLKMWKTSIFSIVIQSPICPQTWNSFCHLCSWPFSLPVGFLFKGTGFCQKTQRMWLVINAHLFWYFVSSKSRDSSTH